MNHKPRTYLEEAIQELIDSARRCPKCRRLFVYGREGSIFCSVKCARQATQVQYRRRRRKKEKDAQS